MGMCRGGALPGDRISSSSSSVCVLGGGYHKGCVCVKREGGIKAVCVFHSSVDSWDTSVSQLSGHLSQNNMHMTQCIMRSNLHPDPL